MRLLPGILVLSLLISSTAHADDWPQVNHDAARTGRTADEPKPPSRVEWVRQFPGEVVATRVEPIVAGGRVFVGTYSGRLYALDAATGREIWTARLDGPVLHSVAVSQGICISGTAG